MTRKIARPDEVDPALVLKVTPPRAPRGLLVRSRLGIGGVRLRRERRSRAAGERAFAALADAGHHAKILIDPKNPGDQIA